MSTCRAQSDSMQENPMLVVLGKGDWGGGGEEGKEEMEEGKKGGGLGDHKVENKCDFSCHQKEAMSFA